MKIIREGAIPSNRIWVGECSECKSAAEAFEYELKVRHERDGSYAWHQCPVCKVGNDQYGGMCFHLKEGQ